MDICRTCADECSAELVPIFSKLDGRFIATVIVNCSDVSIKEDDGLPTYVCATCLVKVEQILSFARQVREADRKLRQLFKLEAPAETMTNEQDHFITIPMEVEVKMEVEDEDEFNANHDRKETNILVEKQESDDFEDDNDSDWKGDDKSSDESREDGEKPKRLNRRKPIAVVNLDPEGESCKTTRRRTRRKADDEENAVEAESSETKCRKASKPSRDYNTDDGDDDVNSDLDEVELEIYTLVQPKDGTVFCCHCHKDFPSMNELLDHGKQKHSKKVRKVNYSKKFVCDVCYCRYMTQDALDEHYAMRAKLHTRKIYECSRCSNRFATVKRRRLHAHNHPKYQEALDTDLEEQKERIVTCCMKTCNQTFLTKEELLEHGEKEHSSNKAMVTNPLKPHECPVCFKTFEKLESLKRHRYRIFMSSVQCSICGKQVKNRNALYNHERLHNSDKTNACEICGKGFKMIAQLKNHYTVHNDEKPFVCKECGWSFKRSSTLKHHMLQHTDMQPWKCEVCGKCFKGKYHLQYHMRIHTGHKPWKCRYCEKSFADHANRARHETSHTGIKPYKCTYCDKTFIRRRFQIEHESTHTGIKPYRCERCNLTFGQKSALKKHLDIHPLAPENQLSLAQPSPMPLSVADSPMPSPSPSSMHPPPPPPSSTVNPSHSSTGHPSPSGVPYPHM